MRAKSFQGKPALLIHWHRDNVIPAYNKKKDWTDHQYLIINEVNMMNYKMLINLNMNLKKVKSRSDDYFNGINNLISYLWMTFFSWLLYHILISTSTNHQNENMIIIYGDPSISSSYS
jgi:hypothetical protein